MRRSRFIFAGISKRFAIEQIEQCFHVRDADAITDAEIREGKRSPVVGVFNSLPEAKTFCARKEAP